MNAASLPRRFLLRLALPAAAMAALFSAGEPLPEPAPTALVIVQEELRTSTERLRLEAAQLEQQSQQAAERARTRASAAAMRWLITLPAASGRRCLVDECAD